MAVRMSKKDLLLLHQEIKIVTRKVSLARALPKQIRI
jgi:hypothetical protein